MLQQVSRSFPPEPSSVRQARELLREFLHEGNRADVADRAELALSEVVTNAVLHAHTDFDVTLCWSAGGLRVEVVDRSRSPRCSVCTGWRPPPAEVWSWWRR